jgi:hypothetical protein
LAKLQSATMAFCSSLLGRERKIEEGETASMTQHEYRAVREPDGSFSDRPEQQPFQAPAAVRGHHD